MAAKLTVAGCGDAFGSGGRYNACFIVDVAGIRFALDFGASSLIAIKKLDIDPNTIDVIICSHIHGDHCGGVPYLFLDAMLGAKRDRPITIVGPKGLESGILAMRDALFPGMHIMKPKFEISFIEMDHFKDYDVGQLKVHCYPAIHTRETNPTSVRVTIGEKTISYTGDSAWTEHMPILADGADLLIAECYFYTKPVRFHLNYPELQDHWKDLRAKRIILTHMSPEMLAQKDMIPEKCAYDGMTIEF